MPGLATAVRSMIAFFRRSESGLRRRSTPASAASASSSASARPSLSSSSDISAPSAAASMPSQPYSRASRRRRSNAVSSPSMRGARGCALAFGEPLGEREVGGAVLDPAPLALGILVGGPPPGSSDSARDLPRLDLGDQPGERRVAGRVLDAHQDRPEVPVAGGRSSASFSSSSSVSPVRRRIRREYPSGAARCHPAAGQPFAQTGVRRWGPDRRTDRGGSRADHRDGARRGARRRPRRPAPTRPAPRPSAARRTSTWRPTPARRRSSPSPPRAPPIGMPARPGAADLPVRALLIELRSRS